MKVHIPKLSYFLPLISIIVLAVGLPTPVSAEVTVTFEAGTPAGWDFYDLDGDIAKNNTVDWDDIGVIAQRWLDAGCGDPNQWCTGADIDGSTGVDFIDYTFVANDWARQGAKNVLLQTIYGTDQDANGTITANTGKAMTQSKGCAMVFAVSQNTALDKGIFKVYGAPLRADENIQIRLYNVTGKNYLLFSGHPTVSKSDPGGGGAMLFDITATTPNPVLSHSELGDGRTYVDMVINFGSLELAAGEYFIVFDGIGPSNTWGTMTRGNTSAFADEMGLYGQGGPPLPKRATVSVSGFTGNTFHYELTAVTDTTYTARSYLLAFQMTIANRPPTVNAGLDQTIQAPASANLTGTASDDGFPDSPGAFTITWSKVSGPGTVTFGDANALNTTAAFSALGTYVLRLTADDDALISSDDVTVIYTNNSAPAVNAGTDQTVGILDTTALDATVTDDGLPNPPAAVITLWTQQDGPGTAIFTNANAVDTTVTFPVTGIYVLRLTADDNEFETYDEVTVEVVAGSLNSPPVVNAGSDQNIMEPQDSVSLDATVTDDGKPIPPGAVTTTWTKTSGPGTVNFGNISNVDTTATFSAFGTYVLRLTADDGVLETYDEVTVIYRAYTYEGYDANSCTGVDIGTCTVSGLTAGGNNGTVVHVTSLADSGSGTLRTAIDNASGVSPGTKIVFDVSGTINTTDWLHLIKPYVTIAGETAPGAGITINGAGNTTGTATLQVNTHNVIIRHLRIRNNGGSREIVQCDGDFNLIFDHLSVSGGADGLLDTNDGTDNVIISRCLFADGVEGSRSYGNYASIHHNVYSYINRRQPKIVDTIGPYDFRNNIVQYWTGTGTNVEFGHQVNIINNYFGPPAPGETCNAGFNIDLGPGFSENVYISGNYFTCGYDINGLGDRITPNQQPNVITAPVDTALWNDVRGNCGALPRDSYDEDHVGPAN